MNNDYIDLRLKYKKAPGDILVTGLSNIINESISNILSTRLESRLFNRGFGSNISDLLFQPMNNLTSRAILVEIQQALERNEPRIEIIFSKTNVSPDFDNYLYSIKITYRILNTQEIGQYSDFIKVKNKS